MPDFDNNPLLRKSMEFSIMAVAYAEELEAQRKYIVARQFLRSATSVGANAMEAQTAESNADFIHKLKIADKEAHETKYWLHLCQHSPSYPKHTKLFPLLEEVMKLLNAIISTSSKRRSSVS